MLVSSVEVNGFLKIDENQNEEVEDGELPDNPVSELSLTLPLAVLTNTSIHHNFSCFSSFSCASSPAAPWLRTLSKCVWKERKVKVHSVHGAE